MSSSLELGLSVRVLSYCSHFTSVLVYTAAAAQTAHTLLLAAPPKAVLCSPCCLCHMAIFTSHPALQDIIFVARRPVVHHLFIYFFAAWCVEEKCTIMQVFLTTIFRDTLTHRGRCCNHLQIWVCGRNFAKKTTTWQSPGFWFWLLLDFISKYDAILSEWRYLSFRRKLQRLLVPYRRV